MFRSMRKYRRRWLAIFGVILMVAFLIPTTVTSCDQRDIPAVRFGANHKLTIMQSEAQRAENEWDALLRLHYPNFGIGFVHAQFAGFFLTGSGWFEQQIALLQADRLVRRINGVSYALLLREAQNMGVRADPGRVEHTCKALGVPWDPELGDPRTHAVVNFLTVLSAFDSMGSAVKVSQPAILRRQADRLIEIGLYAIELDARDPSLGLWPATRPASGPASAPADPVISAAEEMEHFNRYRSEYPWNVFSDVMPEHYDAQKNPMGLGYRLPNRVKIEYLEISREVIRKHVFAPEAAALRYYRANKETEPGFLPPTTQVAAAQPATKPTTGPATTQAATQPTTRPTTFEDFKYKILERLADEFTGRFIAEVAKEIGRRMVEDYEAMQAARKASTRPVSSVGVPYDSADYLSELILSFAKANTWGQKYKALYREVFLPQRLGESGAGVPDVNLPLFLSSARLGQWLSKRELAELGSPGALHDARGRVDGPGSAVSDDNARILLPDYAIDQAAPLLDDKLTRQLRAAGRQPIEVLQPSPLFKQEGRRSTSYYIFRLHDAQKAGVPQSIVAVQAEVRADLLAAKRYERALTRARKLLEDARRLGGIQAAANDPAWRLADSKVVVTDGFTRATPGDERTARIPGLNLGGYPLVRFRGDAFKLLDEHLVTGNPRPVAVIEAPLARKVFVVEFNPRKFEPLQRELLSAGTLVSIRESEAAEHRRGMLGRWFDPKDIESRMNANVLPGFRREQDEAAEEPLLPL